MKTRHLVGLALLSTLCSGPVLAQTTTPSTTTAPGVPIDPSNTTITPAVGTGTVVPGQPGTTPPVVTPAGTVYPPATTAPSKKMQARKRTTKTTHTTKRP
ncbi:MAG: hypothetical protein ACRYFV_03695 [Janthinobacterium lividum]